MDTQPVDSEITSDEKLWALLAYVLSPLVPVILLFLEDKRNRPFIKAHLIQSLILGLVIYVLGSIFTFVLVGFCIMGVGFIAEVYFGLQAYQGKYVNIPVLTDFIKRQGWA